MTWKPKARAALDPTLPLTPEEGFVLSRLDGTASVEELAAMTGIDEARLSGMLARLMVLGVVDPKDASPVPAPPSSPPQSVRPSQNPSRSTKPPEDDAAPLADPEGDTTDDDDDETDEDDASGDAPKVDEATHRKLFETELHPQPVDVRVAMARTESGARLLALCFDPEPRVVQAVLESSHAGLDHARLVAMHHRNPVGLEAITSRSELVRDREVGRRLLRNGQTSDAQIRRLLEPRQLREVYAVAKSTDVAERARTRSRELLNQKFMRSEPQARFDFVWSTEGRVLAMLQNAPFDARTTQLFCARPIGSVLLITNLVKFRACPPLLLAHLLKQPVVKSQVGLRKLVLQHPNMPADLKKRG